MMVKRGEDNAKRILSDHKKQLHRLAKGLLTHETLSRDEISTILLGKEIQKPEPKENSKKEANKGGGHVKGGVLPATAMDAGSGERWEER